MTRKEQIQQEIEKTLQSIDGMKRAEANPFLFTRIKARMQKNNNGWERTFSFVSRPAIALAIVILVMAVNAWAVWGSSTTEENVTAGVNNASTSELANEYNMVASVSNYDYENSNNKDELSEKP